MQIVHIMEGLVKPKVRAKNGCWFWIRQSRAPDYADSENIKLKIGSRSLLYQLFLKRDF
jgi:hypothetical protein